MPVLQYNRGMDSVVVKHTLATAAAHVRPRYIFKYVAE